jgi:hypothetical protein
MTPAQIRAKRVKLELIQDASADAVMELRTVCDHSCDLTMKCSGDGGSYYDPPEYWIEWHCHDCGKSWNSPQTREHWEKYPNARREK